MHVRKTERAIQWNWVAIFSYAACVAISAAIWTGVIRGVQYLVR